MLLFHLFHPSLHAVVMVVVQSVSCVQLFETPWTVACQAPLYMVQPRQEYWNGLPFPSPGDLSKKLLCLISSSLHHNRDRSHISKTLMNVGLLSCVLFLLRITTCLSFTYYLKTMDLYILMNFIIVYERWTYLHF